jgi:hypothetical protein
MESTLTLLPDRWFEFTRPPKPPSIMWPGPIRLIDQEAWENLPVTVHYNLPLANKVSLIQAFQAMTNAQKVEYLEKYSDSDANHNTSDYSYQFNNRQKHYNSIMTCLVKKDLLEKLRLPEEPVSPPAEKKKTPAARKKAIPKALKTAVWIKYISAAEGISKCMCCGIKDISQMDFDCGHVVAEACGGSTTIENLRPICSKCNKSMGTTNMNDFKTMYFS